MWQAIRVNVRTGSRCAAVLALAIPVWAAPPAWFDNGAAKRGFMPGVADFYQHQYYVADPADTWESSRPFAAILPNWARVGGYCEFTAVTDSLAVWQARGYTGAVQAGTLTPTAATWQAASKATILDVRSVNGTTGMSDYLKNKYTADQAGPKLWPTKLKYDQFTIDNTSGQVTTAAGTVLKNSGAAISSFEVYRRMLLNESTPLLYLTRNSTSTYDNALWWGNFHYVAGAGIDVANGLIFVADPDSNKGNASGAATYKPQTAVPSTPADAGNGGWSFYYTDPSKHDGAASDLDNVFKTSKIIDAKTGAAFDPLTQPNWFYATSNTGTTLNGNAKGTKTPIVVKQKAADANIDARKFTGADNAIPVATPNGKADPANYSSYYGTLKFDTSATNKAFKITQSDSNAGNGAIAATGRYHDVQLSRLDVISIAAADPVGDVAHIGGGRTTDMVLFGAAATPIDHFQIEGIGNAAINDPLLSGKTYLSTNNQAWLGTYMTGNDAFENPTSGFWDFQLLSPGSPGLGEGNQLDVQMLTSSSLTQYEVLFHTQAGLDTGGNAFGDYWMVQTFGFADIVDPEQTDRLTPATDTVAVPEPVSLWLLPMGLMALMSRRRTAREHRR